MKQQPRNKAHERQGTGRLHREAEAAPEREEDIMSPCARAHVRSHPGDEKPPKKGKDCEVKRKYLQSFQDARI